MEDGFVGDTGAMGAVAGGIGFGMSLGVAYMLAS